MPLTAEPLGSQGMGRTNLIPLTVITCTLNERANIGACLESVAWADQRLVVDAFSTDGTVEYARSLGAEAVSHEWAGYSDQKNWAMDTLPIRNEWLLFLDADERVSSELAAEIRLLIDGQPQCAGYHVARRLIFLGRWLKHCWWYPDYNLRLFRKGMGRFEKRLVHETVVLNGPAGYLRNDLIHDDQRDIATYISRLNRYSSLEAQEMFRVLVERRSGEFEPSWRGTWMQRRRALKERVWYHLPLRPLIRFLWTIVLRRGILDGKEGFIFTVLACINEWQAEAKLYELKLMKRQRRIVPDNVPNLSHFRASSYIPPDSLTTPVSSAGEPS